MQARRFTTINAGSKDRRGTFAPAAIIALVVVVSGVALVLDKLWLDAATLELNTAIESAALAAGRSLADDDLLRTGVDIDSKLERTRQFAVDLAAKNLIAGSSVQLDPAPDGSIRFGKLVYQEDIGETMFVETTQEPTSVVVFGERSHSKSNPVALFWQGITGASHGNVFARTEASVDNHVVALRPLDGVPIPAMPLAIMKYAPPEDSDGASTPCWVREIDQRRGKDQWGIDPETKQPANAADGIPEITLKLASRDSKATDINAHFFALDPLNSMADIEQQFKRGWTIADFKSSTEPELRLNQGPLRFSTIDTSGGNIGTLLQPLIGESRIVLLYDQKNDGQLICSSVVAGRLMALRVTDEGDLEAVFQPAVLTTRTAVLVNETLVSIAHPASANSYIYKLQLTF